ncbi:MAG: MlaD family protein [Muribaculaceae bacterium]|nr:MlaD family protein [Muribaculaceae bacterium]
MKKLFSKELIIGLSVILAIVILVFGIEYLKGINMFSPANFYYVSYNNVSGLEVSAPVTIDGYKVGQVREITYDYDNPGKIKVLLAVNKKLRVPEDSYAVLASTLMSGGYIDIKMGSSKKMLAVGSDIATKEVPGLMDALASDVVPAVNSILPRIDSLLYNLNRIAGDPALAQSISRLDGITGNILSVTEGLDGAMKRDVPGVMRNARSITTRLDTVSANLAALSSQLRQLPISTTMDNVNEVTENLVRFSDQLNSQTSTLGKLTNDPELYDRLNKVSADIDSLVLDIKKNPKRYISIKLF